MLLNEALHNMKHNGYCLWLGAGVTTHLARAAGIHVAGWPELVERLEARAGVASAGGSLQARLSNSRRALGWERFQRELRSEIGVPVAFAAVQLGVEAARSGGYVPAAARQLARLGHLANPVVSFNIEHVTSTLTGAAEGPTEISAFSPRVEGSVAPVRTLSLEPDVVRFRRLVYHPHGALDIGGICVMTDEEYGDLHNGTLAMQLAVHAAFGRDLAIVGMSLEDEYLRRQLEQFRPYLGEVFWFVDDITRVAPTALWAIQHRLHVVEVGGWPTFWAAIDQDLPAPSEEWVIHAWRAAFDMACRALEADRFLMSPPSTDERIVALDEKLRAYARASGKVDGALPERCLDWDTFRLIENARHRACEKHGEPGVPAAEWPRKAPPA